MSSKRRSLFRSFSSRLAVSFALAFILGSLALFGFAYFLVSSSLQKSDRSAIQLKLKEYSDEYQAGASAAIRRKVDTDTSSGALRGFMIRLANAQSETLLLKPPGEEAKYEFKKLEGTQNTSPSDWIQLKATSEDDILDIASLRLPDGSLLQVGKGPDEREDLLDQFRNIFVTVLLAVVLLSLFGGTLLARQALRPVRSLISVLGPIIDTGKTKDRIPVSRTGDEFEELSVRFNQALEKIGVLVEGMRAAMDNVAHDLRTPMTRLRGVAEMALQAEPKLESYREALSDCLEESEQVLRMLNMLMDISEVEAGSTTLDIGKVNVFALVSQAYELYRGVAEDKNIAMKIECSGDLSLSGDRNRLLQVMANLLDNAIKYTRPGGAVEIAASLDGDQVVLSVRDSGVGIASEDLAKIWDRFYRGDKSRTQRGLGLGLSLVKAVIQGHKGRIEVLSEVGHGTQFVIYLPADAVATRST